MAGTEQSGIDRQIVWAIRRAEHIQCSAVVISFAVTVPSPVGIGIEKLAFADTLPVACLAAVAEELSVRTISGCYRGAIANDTKVTGVANQPFCRRRQDEQRLEQVLQQIMFFGRVMDLALGQDAGDELLCNLRIFGFLLLVLLTFLSRFFQAAFQASCLMGRGCLPKPSEEVIERADAGRIVRGEAAEDGINRHGAKRTNPVINAHPQLGHDEQAAQHVCRVARFPAFGFRGVT